MSYILNKVRSITNTGIVVQGTTMDPCFQKCWFVTIPSISIDGSTCYIDYSDTYNNSDRVFLKRIFSNLPVGSTVYFTNTEYYDEIANIRTYIGGTFSYSSNFNDYKTIVGTISSGFTAISNYTFFDKQNFLSVPQLNIGYTGGATAANYIYNTLPNKKNTKFKDSGVLGSAFNFEEYVEIVGSTLNSGRIKTYGSVKLKDETELLYITGSTLTNQNLKTNSTTLNFYIRGESNVSIIEKPQNNTGSLVVYDLNLIKENCYENQNEYQSYLRAQSLGNTYYSYWSSCQDCDNGIEYSSYALNGNKTLPYVNSVYFSIAPGSITVDQVTFSQKYAIYTNRSYSGTSSVISSLSFTPITGNLKLDLSHISLQGWSVDIYTDSNLQQKLISGYYKSGIPGYDQSYILLLYGTSLPKTLYCVFSGPAQLTVELYL
jgi:hypothetical protein